MRHVLSSPPLSHLSPKLYADDTNLIASAHDALAFHLAVAQSGPAYGLITVPHKSIAYVHGSTPDSDVTALQTAGFQIKRDGTTVCGAPIGTDAHAATFLSNHAASLASMHDLLIRFADRHPRQALVLRNAWLAASSNHLFRSTRPDLTTRHLVPLILNLHRSFLAAISIGHEHMDLIGNDSMTIAQLPSSMGGLGFGNPTFSARAGFSASGLSFLSHSARHHSDLPGLSDAVHGAFSLGSSFKAYVNAGTAHLPDRLSHDSKHKKHSKPPAPPPPPDPATATAAAAAVAAVPRKSAQTYDLTAAEILLNPSIIALLANGKPRSGVQRAFSRGMFAKQSGSLALYGGTARSNALWGSAPGGGAFVSAPFTHHDLRMDALAVRSHVTMLIGMKPMALHAVPDDTICSLCVNKRPLGCGAQHLDACPHSPGFFPAHNAIAHTITRICVEAGVDAKHESKSKLDVSTDPGSILTPDITLNTRVGPLALDVAIRRPEQTLALRSPLSLLGSAYRQKLTHYYGLTGGDILDNASLDSHSSFFLNQHDSDYSLIAASSAATATLPALPPATSSMPSRPTRPMVINGITGALEPRSKHTLRQILFADSARSPREIDDAMTHICHRIALSYIREAAHTRMSTIGRFLPSNSLPEASHAARPSKSRRSRDAQPH